MVGGWDGEDGGRVVFQDGEEISPGFGGGGCSEREKVSESWGSFF